jgi:hypothetical protein
LHSISEFTTNLNPRIMIHSMQCMGINLARCRCHFAKYGSGITRSRARGNKCLSSLEGCGYAANIQIFQVADCSNCSFPILQLAAFQVYTDVSERGPLLGMVLLLAMIRIAASYVRSEWTLVWGKLRRRILQHLTRLGLKNQSGIIE